MCVCVCVCLYFYICLHVSFPHFRFHLFGFFLYYYYHLLRLLFSLFRLLNYYYRHVCFLAVSLFSQYTFCPFRFCCFSICSYLNVPLVTWLRLNARQQWWRRWTTNDNDWNDDVLNELDVIASTICKYNCLAPKCIQQNTELFIRLENVSVRHTSEKERNILSYRT